MKRGIDKVIWKACVAAVAMIGLITIGLITAVTAIAVICGIKDFLRRHKDADR